MPKEGHVHSLATSTASVSDVHMNRLCANFALINLYLHRKRLAGLAA